MGILRLSHVDVRVPDLDLATAYYTEVLGLLETGRDAERVFLKCWDEDDHHSVKLSYAPRVGLDLISFKVEADEDLADLVLTTGGTGLSPRDITPEATRAVRYLNVLFGAALGLMIGRVPTVSAERRDINETRDPGSLSLFQNVLSP